MAEPIDISTLTDEDAARLTGTVHKTALPAAKDGAIDISKLTDAQASALTAGGNAPGLLESFGRGAAEGATFGFDDKLGLDKERREASRKANPWTHFMGEMAGSLVPMVGTGGLGAVAKGAGMLPRAARAVSAVMAPGEIATMGQAVGQGAKLGAVYGGLSGMGHTNVEPEDTLPDAIGKRIWEGGKGAAVGALVGAPLGAVGHGLYRGAQSLGTMRAVAQSEVEPGTGALVTAAERLKRDRITPDDLIAQIKAELPAARNGVGDQEIETIVSRYLAGDSAQDISALLTQKGIQQTPQDIQVLLDDLAARHLPPTNIVDRAGMVRPGSGDNTQMTMRAAAATPGEHLGVAREKLLERQIGAGGRMNSLFDNLIGSSDYEAVEAAKKAAHKQAGVNAYSLAYLNEQPFNIQPILDKWAAKYDGKTGPIPRGIMAEINDLWGGNKTAPATLEDFILARQGLFDAKRAAAKDRPSLASKLNELYDEISDVVGKTNPLWKEANTIWRDGKAAEEAMKAGASMSTRLNSASRENFAFFTRAQKSADAAQKEVDQLTQKIQTAAAQGTQPAASDLAAVINAQARLDAAQAEQDLFKVGLVRALTDKLVQNKGETHDLTKELLLPGAQKMLREVLGKDADVFFNAVKAEQAVNRTFRSQFGSQTTPLREAVDELNWAPSFHASLVNPLHWPSKVMDLAAQYAARNVNARRNTDLIKLYTETDPIKQLEILRAMQTLHTARSNAGNLAGKPVIGAGSGALPEALVAGESDYRRIPPAKVHKP